VADHRECFLRRVPEDGPAGAEAGTVMLRARIDHLIGCSWFWIWAFVGVAAGLALGSFGVILLVPVLLVASLMASHDRIRGSAFGLLTGAGLLSLFVAHRRGREIEFDPRPWLVVGILLVAAGVIRHAVRSRRTSG
jgi:hypothetical protein